MTPGPVEPTVRTGAGADEGAARGVASERFRNAMASWASGVTVVAVRDEGRVHATTATSFASVSAEPPVVLLSIGPTAQVRPFLAEGVRFAVSVLSADQRRLASVLADPFPVGAVPFAEDGDPVLDGALFALACSVERALPVEGGVLLVLGLVERVEEGDASAEPLVRWRRAWHALR